MAVKLRGGADAQGAQITGLADGSAATDAVTLQQLQAVARGLDWKNSVKAASTANLTLSGAQTVDGIALIAGDRVGAFGQSTASASGIYIVAAGAWSRATDFDDSTEVTAAAVVPVEQGTTNGGKAFILTGVTGTVTIGTTALTFSQLGGGLTYSAADQSITVSGTTIAVHLKASGGLLLDAVNGLYLDAAYTGLAKRYSADCVATTNPQSFTHNLGTKDVDVTVRNKATDEIVVASVVATDTNTVTVDFGGAPTSAQWRVTVQG